MTSCELSRGKMSRIFPCTIAGSSEAAAEACNAAMSCAMEWCGKRKLWDTREG